MFSRILYSLQYRLNKVNLKEIKGSNNQILNSGTIQGCKIEIYGNNNKIEIAENSIIKNTNFYIKGNNITIKIGSQVCIKGGELWAEDNQTQIVIGSKTTIESAHIAVTEDNRKIEIGEDCMFAKEIEIRSGDSHSILNDAGERINPAEDVIIGNHVWISNRATILKGVHLDNNCIIGIGSIVTSSLSPNTLAGGVPAHEIKKGVNWTRERN